MNLAFRIAQGGVRTDLPPSLAINPSVTSWIRFLDDGRIEISSGKVEIGQAIRTSLAQIAAEELQVSPERIVMAPTITGISPDEAVTSGSLSIQESGTAIRWVCAEVRARLLAAAARILEIDAGDCEIVDGVVHHRASGRSAGYSQLDPNGLLGAPIAGPPVPRPRSTYQVVGTDRPRIDLPGRITGQPVFIHDLTWPGMLHGRVIRARLPGARLLTLPADLPARLGPGASIWRDGDFLAVTARREWVAVQTSDIVARSAIWSEAELPFDERTVEDWLTGQQVESRVIASRSSPGATATAAGIDTLEARYFKPFLAHASIAPSCALARWDGARLEVLSHSQGVYNLREDLRLCFPGSEVVVRHHEGAGCYGHNGADDVALDAALLARLAGAPVRIVWSRRDELIRAPLGSAMTIDLKVELEGDRIRSWTHEVYSFGHSLRPGRAETPTLLAATEVDPPFPPRIAVNAALNAGGGSERNAIPFYDIDCLEVRNHRILSAPIRTSALRSLGAFGNVFAIESTIDDLAEIADVDPFEFRLLHLSEPRARAVLERLRQLLDGRPLAGLADHAAIGFALARYKNTGAWCAVAAEVRADEAIRPLRLWVVADLGLVINPDGARNQLEGGALQACSWALHESMRFDRHGPLGSDWEGYRIAHASELPRVEVHLISNQDEDPLGAGECAHGPTAAALGNAVKRALGIRIRRLPLSRERLMEALTSSGR